MDRDQTLVAWAAGFLDGEGCFTLYKNTNAKYDHERCVSISACQLKVEPLEKLQSILGGNIRSGRTPLGKKMYQWDIKNASEVREAIDLLRPYLCNKLEDAEIIYEFASTVRRRHRGFFVSEEEILLRQSLVTRLAEIRAT